MNTKNIMIPYDLFVDLLKYHLFDLDNEEIRDHIKTGLETKLEAAARHELYSQYKNKQLTEEEREQARLKYLEAAGIDKNFIH